MFRESLFKEVLFKLRPEDCQRASNAKSHRVNFPGTGTNDWLFQGQKELSMLQSRKDATVAEVKRRRGSRDHTLRGTVNQRKTLAFDSK